MIRFLKRLLSLLLPEKIVVIASGENIVFFILKPSVCMLRRRGDGSFLQRPTCGQCCHSRRTLVMLILSDEAQDECSPKKKGGDAASDPDCFPEGSPVVLISSLCMQRPHIVQNQLLLHVLSIIHVSVLSLNSAARRKNSLWEQELKDTVFWKSAPCDLTGNSEVVAVPQDVWLKAAFRPCGHSDKVSVLA